MPFANPSRSPSRPSQSPSRSASLSRTVSSSSQAKLSSTFDYYSRPRTAPATSALPTSIAPSALTTASSSDAPSSNLSRQPTESTLSLTDAWAATRSFGLRPQPRPRKKAPPPALVLTKAVDMRRERTRTIAVPAETDDGASIRDGDAGEPREAAAIGVALGTPARVSSPEKPQGDCTDPVQWTVKSFVVRNKPLSAVPEIQTLDEQPVISTWTTRTRRVPPRLTIDTSATPRTQSHRSQPSWSDGLSTATSDGTLRDGVRMAALKSRWSDSTRAGSETGGRVVARPARGR